MYLVCLVPLSLVSLFLFLAPSRLFESNDVELFLLFMSPFLFWFWRSRPWVSDGVTSLFQSSNTAHETHEGKDGSLRVHVLPLSLFLLPSDARRGLTVCLQSFL